MRYYDIKILRDDGSLYTFKSLGNAFGGSTSLTSLLPTSPQNPRNGQTNPAALLVELDIAGWNGANPDTNSSVRISGLGLNDLGNASDLNGLAITVQAGMAKGLPLANPAQAGIIAKGLIFQAFGNWIGTSQTLDLVLQSGGTSDDPDAPGNFPFVMAPGTPLGTAIKNTLAIAMPGIPVTVNVSPNLVLNFTQTGHYATRAAFSSFVNALSRGIIGGTSYAGVQITTNGASVVVFDGSAPAQTKAIAFQDLIGQPTWIQPQMISFKTVLRADIIQGDVVTLPQTLFTQSTAGSQRFLANPQNSLTFSGQYQVFLVHHYGNSRAPAADAWNTTFQATPFIPEVPSDNTAPLVETIDT
jgi:hypothetical protein